MIIDRTKFLVLAGTMATVGACQREPYRAPAPVAEPAPPTPSAAITSALKSGPIRVEVIEPTTTTGALSCDDQQGTPGACPSIGPADEGVCPDLIGKRCGELKAALKPRVAQRAIECLQALKGNERCDAARINQCGHAALMSACPEPTPPRQGELAAATAAQPFGVTLLSETTPDTSPLSAACTAITKACGNQPLAPTMADCRQTLAGMNELGRANMVACVTSRCTTGGLLACEAVPKPATTAAAVR